jgi:hypothetical protein
VTGRAHTRVLPSLVGRGDVGVSDSVLVSLRFSSVICLASKHRSPYRTGFYRCRQRQNQCPMLALIRLLLALVCNIRPTTRTELTNDERCRDKRASPLTAPINHGHRRRFNCYMRPCQVLTGTQDLPPTSGLSRLIR